MASVHNNVTVGMTEEIELISNDHDNKCCHACVVLWLRILVLLNASTVISSSMYYIYNFKSCNTFEAIHILQLPAHISMSSVILKQIKELG